MKAHYPRFAADKTILVQLWPRRCVPQDRAVFARIPDPTMSNSNNSAPDDLAQRDTAQPRDARSLDRLAGFDWSRLFHTLVLSGCIVWLAGYFLPPINHDTAVLLYISKLWLEGGRLYVDAIDINTPLVFVLHLLPEALAKLTGLGGPTVLVALLGLGILASFQTCRTVLAASLEPYRAFSAALLPVLLLFLLIVFPNYMFTQREHIMMVLGMPYLLVASARAGGTDMPRRLRIATGLMAGLGFAMKPYFLAFPLLVELYVLSRRGFRSTATDAAPWSVLAVCVAHALFAVLVTPEYFTQVLPMAQDFYSRVADTDLFDLATGTNLAAPTIILPLLGIVAFWGVRSHLSRVIFLAGVAGLISAYAQGKGWPYHALPARAFTLFLAGTAIASVLDNTAWLRRGDRRPARWFASALMLLVFYQHGLARVPFAQQLAYDDSEVKKLADIITPQRLDNRILILSPGIYPHFPLLNYTGMKMTMRFESMWLLQGVYAECNDNGALYNDPARMSENEAMVFRSVAEDFNKGRPSILVVDKIAGIPECLVDMPFSYLDYFNRNPLFAERFLDYEPLLEYDRYEIYLRRR